MIMRSKKVSVTQEMLYEVRDELKSHILSHESRFNSIDKNFESLKAQIEAAVSKLSSDIQKVQAEVHRNSLLAEEQNSRNIYVMDQYELVNIRSEKLEKRIDTYENDLLALVKARKIEPKA